LANLPLRRIAAALFTARGSSLRRLLRGAVRRHVGIRARNDLGDTRSLPKLTRVPAVVPRPSIPPDCSRCSTTASSTALRTGVDLLLAYSIVQEAAVSGY